MINNSLEGRKHKEQEREKRKTTKTKIENL
jgi:hypothetical protein